MNLGMLFLKGKPFMALCYHLVQNRLLKWHAKGFCWSDCKFKASHQNLSNEDEKKTDEYIKELHGEWHFRQKLSGGLPLKRIPLDKENLTTEEPNSSRIDEFLGDVVNHEVFEKTLLSKPSNLSIQQSADNLKNVMKVESPSFNQQNKRLEVTT